KEAVAHERAAAQTPQAARPVVLPRPVEDPRARAAREQKAKASEKEAGKRRAEEADTKRAP
ncbi:MAG: peptidase M23, partial [Pseudomonadota bacterium]|nr:peptidase M23 [Pseudomonadota bacterium]